MSGRVLGEAKQSGCEKMPWKELSVFEFGMKKKITFSISFRVSLLARTEGPAVSEAVPAS